MNETSKKIGLKISFLRKQSHMTQEQLSEEIQISQNFLSQLETGRKTPSILTLHRISGAINVPLSELFDSQINKPGACTAQYSLDKKLLRIFCSLNKTEKEQLVIIIDKMLKKRKKA